ncbi:MAG: SDR family oxidoreductase [Alphaproteobacteria bacterium]|nr:SDR family oxidoreductase [Alphaproteobacteria bacterium]
MPLKEKTVYITGGTGGIGAPLVQHLIDAGALVTAYDIEKEGDLVANIDKTCNHLQHNTPDILINMAGYNVLDYCENQNLDAIVALNMMVPMRLTQAVLTGMKARNSGRIVNIGSMTALIPLPHLTGYVAAKAGLKGFNDALRRELGGHQYKAYLYLSARC